MRYIITTLLLTLLAFRGTAQLSETDNYKKNLSLTENRDTLAWIHSGSLNLGLNEGFLHNWAAGGEIASLSVTGLAAAQLTRLYHNQVWANNLDAAYSLYYAYSTGFVPRKADDRIDFTSKYGARIDTAKNWYITGLFNFKSQFTKGYDYASEDWEHHPVSNHFSPAYFILAAGIEYRKGTAISLFLSPAAGRATVADKYYTRLAPEGAFGIRYGKTAHYELGAYFSGRYTHDFSKNVSFRTRLDLYTNYLAKDTKDDAGNLISHDNPGNIDVLWDNVLTVKLGRYFNMALGLTAIYDNDLPYSSTTTDAGGNVVDKNEPASGLGWWQVKQLMTFGLVYKF